MTQRRQAQPEERKAAAAGVPNTTNWLETQKLDIERTKVTLEEKRILAEQRARIWAQLSAGVPILALVVGFFLNAQADRLKTERDFITRQLNELYYHLYGRLIDDDAIWALWGGESELRKTNPTAADRVEQDFILPNHREILSLIDQHGGLLRNSSDGDISSFVQMLNRYRQHVTVYLALKASGDPRTPYDLPSAQYRYPVGFSDAVLKRIRSLEHERGQ